MQDNANEYRRQAAAATMAGFSKNEIKAAEAMTYGLGKSRTNAKNLLALKYDAEILTEFNEDTCPLVPVRDLKELLLELDLIEELDTMGGGKRKGSRKVQRGGVRFWQTLKDFYGTLCNIRVRAATAANNAAAGAAQAAIRQLSAAEINTIRDRIIGTAATAGLSYSILTGKLPPGVEFIGGLITVILENTPTAMDLLWNTYSASTATLGLAGKTAHVMARGFFFVLCAIGLNKFQQLVRGGIEGFAGLSPEDKVTFLKEFIRQFLPGMPDITGTVTRILGNRATMAYLDAQLAVYTMRRNAAIPPRLSLKEERRLAKLDPAIRAAAINRATRAMGNAPAAGAGGGAAGGGGGGGAAGGGGGGGAAAAPPAAAPAENMNTEPEEGEIKGGRRKTRKTRKARKTRR